MTKKPNDAPMFRWRIAPTDRSARVGEDPQPLSIIASQRKISLPPSSSEATAKQQRHGEIQPGPSISLAELLAQLGASITLTGENDGTWTAELLSCCAQPVLRLRERWDYVKVNAPSLAEAVRGIAGQLEGAYFEMPTPRRWWQFWQLWIPEMPVNFTYTRVAVTDDELPIRVVVPRRNGEDVLTDTRDEGVRADRKFLLLAAGEHALEVARDEELEAILQLLDSEIVWYEEQRPEPQDDANERIADALRDVTRLLEGALHRASAEDAAQCEHKDASERDRVPWRLFDPRATGPRSDLAAAQIPVIRLDVSHRIPGRRHMEYFINEVMVRVEREVGRSLIWRPVDESTELFTRFHVEVSVFDRDGYSIGVDHEGLERIWLKCDRELMRELARVMLEPRSDASTPEGAC